MAGIKKIENKTVTIVVPTLLSVSRRLSIKIGYNKKSILLDSALVKHTTVIPSIPHGMLSKNHKINKPFKIITI